MTGPFRGLSYPELKHLVYQSSVFTQNEKKAIAQSNLRDGSFDYSPQDLQALSGDLRRKFLNLHALRQDSARRFQAQKAPQEEPMPIGQMAVCAITLGLFCAAGCYPSFEEVGDPTQKGQNENGEEADNTNIRDEGTTIDGGHIENIAEGIEDIEIATIESNDYVHDPVLVWNGSRYVISWDIFHGGENWNLDTAASSLYLSQINLEENNAETFLLESSNGAITSSMVWTGNQYGIVWNHDVSETDRKIYFVRVNESGQKIGVPLLVSGCEYGCGLASLGWSGLNFMLTWFEGEGNVIRFKKIDNSGNVGSGSGYRADYTIGFGILENIDLAVGNEDQYATIFTHYQTEGEGIENIYFTWKDSSRPVRITNYFDRWLQSGASMVWNGNGYAVTWSHCEDVNGDGLIDNLDNCEIYFRRLDLYGTLMDEEVQITNNPYQSEWPHLVWTGSEYGLSWQDQRDGNWEVYFTRIDADGNKLENDVRVTNTAGESTPQSLAWNDLDREYAIYIREQVFEGPNRSFQIARIFGNFSR